MEMIKLHQLEGYIQSIYLAEYAHGLLLLDGCCRADIPIIKAFIEQQLNRPLSDLKTVIVTHMHPDHAGAAHKLRSMCGCSIASANSQYPWYSGIDGMLMHWTDMALAVWVAGRKGKPKKNLWYPARLKPDVTLSDGDVVPGFNDWQIMEMPGHTDRDLSVLHLPSQRIYVADLMVIVKQQYSPPYPVFYPNRYKRSLQRLKALKPDGILLAHGGEVALSDEEMDTLIARAPTRPLTHWRSVKYKFSQLFKK